MTALALCEVICVKKYMDDTHIVVIREGLRFIPDSLKTIATVLQKERI